MTSAGRRDLVTWYQASDLELHFNLHFNILEAFQNFNLNLSRLLAMILIGWLLSGTLCWLSGWADEWKRLKSFNITWPQYTSGHRFQMSQNWQATMDKLILFCVVCGLFRAGASNSDPNNTSGPPSHYASQDIWRWLLKSGKCHVIIRFIRATLTADLLYFMHLQYRLITIHSCFGFNV